MANFNSYGYPYGMPYTPFQNYNSIPNNNYNYQQPQQTQTNQFAFVNGIEGAKSFQMQPNQTILLMDSDNPVVYMKTSNQLGQSTLRYFKLIETSENDLKVDSTQPKQDYVLKSDFEALNKKVEDLLKRYEKMPKRNENKLNSEE